MDRSNVVKSKRRWVLCIVVLLVVLGQTGCSGFQSLLGSEPVTIKFAFFERTADYEGLVEEFQSQHPNITVELDPAPFQNNPERNLQTRAAEADAVRIPAMMVSEEVGSAFLPLDSMITTARNFSASDLFPGSQEALKLGGKQVAIPAGINPYVVFYLPSKFAEAGVTPPAGNWSMEDFLTSAMSVNNTDESLRGTPKYTYGFCSHPAYSDPVLFAFMFGGNVFDNIFRPTTPTLNIQANVDALAWYTSLNTDFGLMPPDDRPNDVGALVARGNCGFWLDWFDRTIFGRYMNNEVAALPLPVYGKPFSVATLDSYAIMADSLHPEETWEWISFLMSKQIASGRLVPPLISQLSSEEYAGRVSPASLDVARSLSANTIMLGLEMYGDPRFGQSIELFSEAAQKVYTGEMDAQSALDQAQQQAEQSFR